MVIQVRTTSRSMSWRVGLVAALLAGLALGMPVPEGEAHTCTPDPTVGVSGRLLVPRGSGLASIELPSRDTGIVTIAPQLGNAAGVAISPDGRLLAVPRFWRPPQHQVGGQDILVVGPDGGDPVATLDRGQPGDVLGAPVWLPDGSLIYERRTLSGSNEAVRIERARPGQPGQLVADGASSPGVSSDGSLLAMIRFSDRDRLVIRRTDDAPERVLVDTPHLISIAFPRFSPDGAWIAFTAAADQGVASPAAGTQQDARPAASLALPWAAAQSLVALGSRLGLSAATAHAHGIPWDVWVIRPDGTGLRQVTSFADDDSSVAWSPDGRWLVTLSAEALHVVALDGVENYCISSEGGYGALEWLP
jgi:Tol biopolymer transport system component